MNVPFLVSVPHGLLTIGPHLSTHREVKRLVTLNHLISYSPRARELEHGPEITASASQGSLSEIQTLRLSPTPALFPELRSSNQQSVFTILPDHQLQALVLESLS